LTIGWGRAKTSRAKLIANQAAGAHSAAHGSRRKLMRARFASVLTEVMANPEDKVSRRCEMPNCDFYGLREDHRKILSFILDETDCRVFELYSEVCAEIREFTTTDDVLALYDSTSHTNDLLLSLYAPAMVGDFVFRKISLAENKFGNVAFRFQAHGWGSIQLYLGKLQNNMLYPSHTNHNSEKRAAVGGQTYSDLGPSEKWNWSEVNRISSRINRFIRKLGAEKCGSLPILPAALEWRGNGGMIVGITGKPI